MHIFRILSLTATERDNGCGKIAIGSHHRIETAGALTERGTYIEKPPPPARDVCSGFGEGQIGHHTPGAASPLLSVLAGLCEQSMRRDCLHLGQPARPGVLEARASKRLGGGVGSLGRHDGLPFMHLQAYSYVTQQMLNVEKTFGRKSFFDTNIVFFTKLFFLVYTQTFLQLFRNNLTWKGDCAHCSWSRVSAITIQR